MIKIEIWSDINCPFCYIGKRHLEKALSDHPQGANVVIEWKSFELDPSANPPKGADNADLLAKKYGKDRAWANQMNENLSQMAALAGLKFQMAKVVPANSFNAHRLIHLARTLGKQDEMKEKLLSAKFVEGLDINDSETLKKIALSVGIDAQRAEALLSSSEFAQEVRQDEAQAAKLGISGVPFFVLNSKYALSGAQPVETFKEVLSKL